jgi:ankyrin repeat protein
VELLLASDGVNPDSKDIIGQTPLFLAESHGHNAVIKLLLRQVPDLKIKETEWALISLLWVVDYRHGHF